MGKEVNKTPQTSSGSGEGFTEIRIVYKYSKTGKLTMVTN